MGHGRPQPVHHQKRQQQEQQQGHVRRPRVGHAVTVQRLPGVYQVIMPQRKQVGQRLERRVHGRHREREPRYGKRQHAPDGGEAQPEAQRGQHADHEHAACLRGQHQQERSQQHGQDAAVAGEMEETVEPSIVEGGHDSEHHGVGQQLAAQGHVHRPSSHAQPLVGGMLLHLCADGVGRGHEDEQHEDARQDGVAQVHGIVEPRVVDGMGVNDDGLEEAHGLFLGSTLGVKHGAPHGPVGQFRHGFHVPVQERACNEVGIVRVERGFGLAAGLHILGEARGDVIKPVNVAPLHGSACFGRVGVVGGDMRLLESVKVAHEVARGCGIVHVDGSYRKVGRQPVAHERGEEHVTEQGRSHHGEDVERPRHEPPAFAPCDALQALVCLPVEHEARLIVVS